MHTLIVFAHTAWVVPFMQMEINEAKKYFDRVVYVTPPLNPDNSNTIVGRNVEIVRGSNKDKVWDMVVGMTSVFRPSLWRELFHSRPSLGAVRQLGIMNWGAALFERKAARLLKKRKTGEHFYILAEWFRQEALAAARVKKKYPFVKAFSLAHSFEVQPDRNPNLLQYYHDFHHQHLDKVYFISEKVREQYFEGMKKRHIRERFAQNTAIRYLGSRKTAEVLNPTASGAEAEHGEFHIVTCSRIDANKRLPLVVEALRKWDGRPILWTVIGEGVDGPLLREAVTELCKANPKIRVEFKGRLANEQVRQYYADTHVDLFVNVSWSEGLPVSIMEATSYGIPALATDVGGTSEVVTEQSGRLLKRDFSSEEFLAALKRLATMAPEETEKLRLGAFGLWKERFDIQANAKSMYDSWFAM